ncbi:unnamed protein product [Urochloa decumbens]|uniref:Uncharacterized protein n=1 Tax=Urochloa decumbens TaxID=240449 RepID=A0ABC8Z8T3_9POAL
MSSAARRRSARGIHGGAAPAAERDDDGDAGDVVTVDYRFSILAARRSIVDQLSEEQEEVVRSIGFGGVLHLTRYNKLDRHFSAWLCNQLTAAAAAAPAPVFLADGAGTEVPVTARDVHEVLGVPNGERQVVGCPGRGDPAAKERDAAAVRRALGLGDGEALTLQAAEAVVARRRKDATPPPGPMTPAERDAFVVAFLLLLVEHFFAPGSVYRRGKVNEEVFHALAVPAEVHLYDWAEYVLDEFCRCAGRVREQVASRCSKISLSGCLLFLQIFYIDRLELRAAGCQVPRGVQPRVAAYDYKSLYKLLELDRQPEWPEGGLKLFGKLKFITAKPAPTQMDDFRSTSEDPPPCVHASDDSEMHENTNILPVMDQILDGFKEYILSKMNRNGQYSKLHKGEQSQRLPHEQHVADAAEGTGTITDHSYSGNNALRVQSGSNGNNIFANLQSMTQQEVPTKKRSRSDFHIRRGTECALDDDMTQTASPSSEKKLVIQVTSCQTTSDSSDDVVILETNPFESSTVGSYPQSTATRAQSRSGPEVFPNLQPRTKQEPSEGTSPAGHPVINGANYESYHDMIQGASHSSGKKPAVQVTSCQTASGSSEDVVILDTNPFKSNTVGFDPQNSTPCTQSRSKPEVFSNLHPRSQQEAPSEKTSQTELQVRKGSQCDSYHDNTQATSACPEEKPVVQKTSCQTTPKDYPSESETGHTPSCRSPEMKKQHVFGRSQFEMGLVHPQPPMKDAEACFKWLDACCYADDQLKWTWVILEEPAPIRVDGLYIKLSMIRAGELKAEVCNLVMRLYLQLDDQIYQDSGTAEPRWCHFLPAKWSSLALKHGDKICESSLTVRTMFSGQHIAYDVGLCRMIIVPVELEGSWSCYAWDLKEKRLNILDPLLSHSGNNEEAIRLKHSSSAPLLLGALLTCLSRYCNSHGYDHQESSPDSWETKILKDLEGMHTFYKHNTGMYTLFYAREFDGKGLKQTVGPRTIASLRRDLLYQMLTMRGNSGRPPSIVGCPVTGPVP